MTPDSGEFAGAIGVKVASSTFTATNTGDAPTGAITVDLSGTGFTLTADQCTGKMLPAGGTCTVGVGFFSLVGVSGVYGQLDVSAEPGGSATVKLTGSAVVAAHLTVAPDTDSGSAFGDVQVGASKQEHFVVSNTGMQTTSPIQIDVTGAGFRLSPASGASDCLLGSTALPGGGTCTLSVALSPTAHGPVSGSLAIGAVTGGTPAPITLTGNGIVPPTITVDVASKDFGILEVGVATAPLTLTFTNTGDVATGAITRSSSSELSAGTGCAAIAAHSSCTVQVTFKAANAGARAAMLTLTGAAGGSFTFNATAEGRYRLTLSRPGAAAGRVTSSPAGIDCSAAGGATCSALFANGPVLLSARTTNGTNAFFSGWTGGGCAGPFSDCTVVFGSATTVVATFTPMTNNLVFFTHDSFAPTLGGVSAYDAKCNAAATAAGLNNLTGTSYIAYVSSPASLATARIGSARGWVRLDGHPFGDVLSTMLSSGQIFNIVDFDETGKPVEASPMTGAKVDGQLAESCSGWTDATGSYRTASFGGPYVWSGTYNTNPCTQVAQLLCMGVTKTAAVTPQISSGRKIWVSNTVFSPGTGVTPDQKCNSERPSGVTTAAALISTTSAPASSVLVPAQSYVRPDGTLVGTGAQIASTVVESGIWQSAAGTYLWEGAWSGSLTVGAVGTLTCADWTSSTSDSLAGSTAYPTLSGWWGEIGVTCADSWRLYCVQTAP